MTIFSYDIYYGKTVKSALEPMFDRSFFIRLYGESKTPAWSPETGTGGATSSHLFLVQELPQTQREKSRIRSSSRPLYKVKALKSCII
jgi:hypothetical protein